MSLTGVCAFSPQPHPNFIEVSGDAAVNDCDRAVERAGKDVEAMSVD
jgi:hypothetical protein